MEFSTRKLFKSINDKISFKNDNYIRSALDQIDFLIENAEVNDSFCNEYYKLKRKLEIVDPNIPNVFIGILTSAIISLALQAYILFIILIAILLCIVAALIILFSHVTKQNLVLEPYLLKKMEEKIYNRSKTLIVEKQNTVNKEHKMRKYIVWTIVLVILLTALLIVADVFNITKYIPLSSNYDWLSYIGALMGGLIGAFVTIGGIYITIKHERKIDQEKSRVENMPIFEYKVGYNSEDFDNSQGQLAGETISHINLDGASYDSENVIEWHYNLLISNIGLGHGLLESVHIDFGNEQHQFIQDYEKSYTYQLVKLNEQRNEKFLIYAPSTRFKDTNFLYSMTIIIKYQDLLGNHYSQKLYSCISYSLTQQEDFNSGIPSADLHYYENFNYIN